MDWLVVGLGNPGSKYSDTKHNIGWMLIDRFLKNFSPVWKEKFKGEYCQISFAGSKITFLKPSTFMNLSGESVQPCMQFFKFNLDNLLVVHDELDLSFKQIAFKKGGGIAGHNGLRSINEHLGSLDFYRMRVGIGRPKVGDVSSWVLSPFYADNLIDLDKYLDFGVQGLELFLKEGYSRACTEYNKKKLE